MTTKNWTIGLVAILISLIACRTNQQGIASSSTSRKILHDEIERSYILYIPDSVDLSQPVPLVIALHGGTGNGKIMMSTSGFNQVADDNGFIVAYPDGAGLLEDKILTWNVGTCCGYSQRNNIDDVGFIRAMIVDIQTVATIDPKQIYATGMSNGGMMSYRLACEASDLFAAIAPVSGTLNFSPCSPAEPVSLIHFHGTADTHIPYEGGYGPDSLVDVNFTSVSDSVNFWVSQDECAPQSTVKTSGDIKYEEWTGCKNNTSVQLYTIINGGHAWPGGGKGWPGADTPTTNFSASQLIWDFFSKHQKP